MSLQTRLIQRADKVSFMAIEDAYHRMKGFTTLSTSKNPKEYTRQYVDEAFETTDVTGISAAIEFGFDQMLGDPVHDYLVHIIDEELLGTDATVEILTVDFTKPVGDGYEARLRSWATIADTEGDSFDAYTYTGSFRVKSSPIKGVATSTDDFERTCTFTANTPVVLTVTPQTVSAAAGDTQQLEATVTGAENTAVTYASSDENVATVDPTGLITIDGTATAGETATITVTSVADPTVKMTVLVTVQ